MMTRRRCRRRALPRRRSRASCQRRRQGGHSPRAIGRPAVLALSLVDNRRVFVLLLLLMTIDARTRRLRRRSPSKRQSSLAERSRKIEQSKREGGGASCFLPHRNCRVQTSLGAQRSHRRLSRSSPGARALPRFALLEWHCVGRVMGAVLSSSSSRRTLSDRTHQLANAPTRTWKKKPTLADLSKTWRRPRSEFLRTLAKRVGAPLRIGDRLGQSRVELGDGGVSVANDAALFLHFLAQICSNVVSAALRFAALQGGRCDLLTANCLR